MADEICDRDHQQSVFGSEVVQLIGPGHAGFVTRDDLTQQPGRFETGEGGEVDCGFGVSGASQDAAGARFEGQDVAGPGEVARCDVAVRQCSDRVGSVARADAGGRARPIVDADEEGGLHALGVLGDHRVESEVAGTFPGDRGAQETRCVVQEEGDICRRRLLGGHDQIPFVLPVLVVDDDDHLTSADRFDRVLDRREPAIDVATGVLRSHQLISNRVHDATPAASTSSA